MNDRRPRSEDPIDLIKPGFAWRAKGGFRWTPGSRYGAAVDKLLEPLSMGVMTPVPVDAYLAFFRIGDSEQDLLDFANEFGRLGIRQDHFHLGNGTAMSGESLYWWKWEHAQFKTLFDARTALEDNERRTLTALLKKHEGAQFWKGVSLRDAATLIIVNQINQRLVPTQIHSVSHCPEKGCDFNEHVSSPVITPHVQYELKAQKTKGRIEPKAEIRGSSLISSIWLQFAEVVCGARTIRHCEECGQYMDITETARRGSKRMHDRCSLAARMRRYRAGKKEKEGNGKKAR